MNSQTRIRLQLKVSDILLILSRLQKYSGNDEEFSLSYRLENSIKELEKGERKESYTPTNGAALDLGFSTSPEFNKPSRDPADVPSISEDEYKKWEEMISASVLEAKKSPETSETPETQRNQLS